jgi:hypothetical protein
MSSLNETGSSPPRVSVRRSGCGLILAWYNICHCIFRPYVRPECWKTLRYLCVAPMPKFRWNKSTKMDCRAGELQGQVDELSVLNDQLLAAIEVSMGATPRIARKVLGWPKICKLAMHSCGNTAIKLKRLKMAQLLGQYGVFLTYVAPNGPDFIIVRVQSVPNVGSAENGSAQTGDGNLNEAGGDGNLNGLAKPQPLSGSARGV